MPEEDHYLVLWEATCHNPKDGKPAKFLIVDAGDDPNFFCDGCGAESSHLPPVLPATLTIEDEKQAERAKKWGHHRTLIGRLYEKDLRKLAEKDPRGWKIWDI